jgi:ribosomal protein L11 methyltransferase
MFHTRLLVICEPDYAEILMAEIAEAGFDTFMENEKGFEAYVELENYDKDHLENIRQRYTTQTTVIFYQDRIQKKNWNEEWEKSYEPVIIDDQCIIRASFHQPSKTYPYDIVITPKMSFGTGHHATTWLMIKNQLSLDHADKRVLDAGCGTAVLSIMASRRGAAFVDAFDIDDWSIENGKENALINNCTNIRIRKGKIAELKFDAPFDIILANINKNILLMEMPYYYAYLQKHGLLLLSGFYEQDIVDLEQKASKEGLTTISSLSRQTWSTLLLRKD